MFISGVFATACSFLYFCPIILNIMNVIVGFLGWKMANWERMHDWRGGQADKFLLLQMW